MQIHETIIKKLHPHPFYFLGFYLGGVALSIVSFFVSLEVFPIGLLVLILAELIRRAETFYILESGVAREYKFLSTSRKFADFGKIQNLEVNQSFIENILGIGNIHVDTAGMDKLEVSFHGVKYPYEIEHLIREEMKKVIG